MFRILGKTFTQKLILEERLLQSCLVDGVGEAGSRGGSCWEILNYIFIKKTVWWWGRIWFISHCDLYL